MSSHEFFLRAAIVVGDAAILFGISYALWPEREMPSIIPKLTPGTGVPRPTAPPPALRKVDPRVAEALRQRLRIMVTYDEAKIDRLIEFERSKAPGGDLEQWLTSAIELWLRDNR